MFALLPARSPIRRVRITRMRAAAALGTGLILAGQQIAAHRPAVDSGPPGYLPQRIAFAGQRHHALLAGLPARFNSSVLALQACLWRLRSGYRRAVSWLLFGGLLMRGTEGVRHRCEDAMLPR